MLSSRSWAHASVPSSPFRWIALLMELDLECRPKLHRSLHKHYTRIDQHPRLKERHGKLGMRKPASESAFRRCWLSEKHT